MPLAQVEYVVRPARLRGCKCALLPTAERLALYNRASRGPIYVSIAGLNLFTPYRNLSIIQGVNAASQSKLGVVHNSYGIRKTLVRA